MDKTKKAPLYSGLAIAVLLLTQLLLGNAFARDGMNAVEPAVMATEFSLMSTDGGDIKLSDYAGQFLSLIHI